MVENQLGEGKRNHNTINQCIYEFSGLVDFLLDLKFILSFESTIFVHGESKAKCLISGGSGNF